MEWRTVLWPRPQAHPGPVSTPRLASLPEPYRKTRLQRKALTHQPGLFVPYPECALGEREKRKTHVPGDAPRAASRARRWQGGPQKPLPARPVAPRPVPPSPATRPAEPTLQEAQGASCPGVGYIFQSQGPRLLPTRGRAEEPRGPAVPEKGSETEGRRVPPLGCGSGCRSRPGPGRVLLGPGSCLPTFPAEQRRRTRSPRGRRGNSGGRGPGRSPGAGGVLGGGAGGLQSPSAPRPPPSRGARPRPRGQAPPPTPRLRPHWSPPSRTPALSPSPR